MKKIYKKPELLARGSVEEITKLNVKDVIELGKFILPKNSKGLFASLNI